MVEPSSEPARARAEEPDESPRERAPHEGRAHGSERWTRIALLSLGVVGLVSVVAWLRGMERLTAIPGWFYRPGRTGSVGPVALALVAALTPTLIARVRSAARAGLHKRALLSLVLWGALMQFSLHFLSPIGLEQSFERLTVGHGEFLRVAAARRGSLLETLRNYDDLFHGQKLGVFAGSKPPGTLAAYILLDKVAQTGAAQKLLAPLLEEARLSRFVGDVPEAAALAVVLFPLFTFLAIVPLVWLGASLLRDAEAGYDAGLLAYSTPALLLVDLHLDGALFPLLGTTCVACAAHGARTGRWPIACLGGAIGMLGIYCSFALLTCLGIGIGTALLACIERFREQRPTAEVLAPLREALAFVVGALAMLGLLIVVLKFAPVRRFSDALAFHRAWKAGVPTALWRYVSLLEFALYLGIPLVLTLFANLTGSIVRLARGAFTTAPLFSLGMAAIVGALAWREGTNEVARLWLFVVPFLALSVAGGLREGFEQPSQRRLVHALCSAQIVLALVMKVRQPW